MVSRDGGSGSRPELIVELLNTLDLRTYGSSQGLLERDGLRDPERARQWFTSQGLRLPEVEPSSEAWAGVRDIREQLRGVLERSGAGASYQAHLVVHLGASGSVTLEAAGSGEDRTVSELLSIVLGSVSDGSWSRLRVCGAPDCRRAFLDTSPNGSARWCSMRTCGNRMKTRAYRRRAVSGTKPSGEIHPRRQGSRRKRGSFRREGEYWTISYEGRTFRLKDSKGLGYISLLLRHPGREFHVLDLVSPLSPAAGPAPGREPGADLSATSAPLIDGSARAAYRARLADLRAELAEAERWSDDLRATRLREEIDFLAAEVESTLGLGGRERRFTSTSERARVSVTRVIKAALVRISDQSPELKHHLASTLKTGTFCSYAPDPRLPVRWDL